MREGTTAALSSSFYYSACINKIFKNHYSIQEVRSKCSEKLGQNPVQKRTDLIDFGLPCTLDVNNYILYSIFKFNLFKNSIK